MSDFIVDHPSAYSTIRLGARVVVAVSRDLDEAVELVDMRGGGLGEIAKRFDMNVRALRSACRRRGVWIALPESDEALEDLHATVERHGRNAERIAADWQVTINTASRWLALLGERER